jgi:thiamine biosynthesis lipoprotein
MLAVEFETMGCHARAFLEATGSEAEAALDGLPAWFAHRERLLSRFDPTSALARLNASGAAAHVDELLWAAVDVALRTAHATAGLVTPTVLHALEAAGYDRSFERVPRVQDGALAAARAVPSFETVERDARTRSIRLPPGLGLDLGGTAKGWSADLAVASLARFGPALVDVGGDISTSRARSAWPVAIEDPRGGTDALDLVLLREGGIATSGMDFRHWKRAGRAQHHIIDPRTGLPATTDVATVTVLAPRALDAEIAAKLVLLEGSLLGMARIERSPELAAILVRDDGVVIRSQRFDRHVWKESP